MARTHGRVMAACSDCGLSLMRLEQHAECVEDERVGWMLHPFPPIFWRRVTVQALAPIVSYVGPLPQRDSDVLAIQQMTGEGGYVYVICAENFDVLYVGKTIDPTSRMRSHRHKKDWWPERGHLVMLAVTGETHHLAGVAALRLESIAIRDLHPAHNIMGVVR